MCSKAVSYRSCNLCEAICGIEVRHCEDKVLSIKGDKKDPLSRGHICPKALALKDLFEDPDRIRHPLERTENGWREISWKTAFDKAAQGIKAVQESHGKDAFASYLGNPNVHNTGAMLFGRYLHRALNTRNRFSATSVDQLPHHIIAYHLFGHQLKVPVPDIERCKHFLIIGANPIASNGSIMSVPDIKARFKSIKANKGKIIVIDPRRTETAEQANEHYFIKPGSDVLLLLSMINVLFQDKRVSPGKVAAFTDNLQDIEKYVSSYTPDRVAEITGLSEVLIRKITVDFALAENAVCYGRMGVSVQDFGLLCQYLIMLLNILTGRLDQAGGLMFTRPAVNMLDQVGPGHFGRQHSRVRTLAEFNGEFPVATLADEILTEGKDQIKGLITVAGNPVLSTPNGCKLDKALKKLDFILAIDFYINETTRHANIILPPPSPLQREHYDLVFHLLAVRNTAKYSPALFPVDKNGKHDWEIFLELTKRLNSTKSLKQRLVLYALSKAGPKALLALLLRMGPSGGFFSSGRITLKRLENNPHGIDLGALQADLPEGLRHNNGKIHLNLDFYMKDLVRVENHFYSGAQQDEQGRPFLLIGRRHIRSNNSWLHNSLRLVKGRSRCTAHIHPKDANKLGIECGQIIKVTSRVGSIEIPAEVTDTIMPGVVSIPHGWGQRKNNVRQQVAADHPGVNVNELTDESVIDELSGNAVLNGVPVALQALTESVENACDDNSTLHAIE